MPIRIPPPTTGPVHNDAALRPADAVVTPAAADSANATLPDRFIRSPRAVDVLFTPDHDAYAYEARCIDEVIAARRADSMDYPPGENPYKVLYMVFNLRNKEITEKLFAAVKAGVDVQVLVEADQIAPERDWNKVDEWFEQQGLTVLRSDKDVDAATRAGAHLIGIDKKSLMHMKSRIFRYKDPATGEACAKVLSGSLNPGGAPVHNEENLNLLVGERATGMYERRFYEIRDHRLSRNTWDDDQPVNVLFTPYQPGGPTPTAKLFEMIDAEQEMIPISVFALHDLRTKGDAQTLIDKLKAAQARGVAVMAITDRRKSDGTDESGERIMMYGRPAHDDPTDEAMAAAGIPVFELVNTANTFSAVHGKSVLFGLDDMKVMTGAGNWTVAAMGSDRSNPRNEESFVFVDSGKLDDNAFGRAYLANFLHLLRRYDDQYPASAEAVIKKLQSHPRWPKVTLDLSAIAQAYPGREVFLVADHPDIARRTPAGAPGLPVNTSPSASSPPFRPDEPVRLPFGTSLTFKVAVRDPDTGALELSAGDQLVLVDEG